MLLHFLFAAVVVQRKIISPIVKSKKEIDDIINDIDERKGDLTKRITVQSDDEISALEWYQYFYREIAGHNLYGFGKFKKYG